MTRKSTYTIQNGYIEDDDDDERGFLWWLGRIILVICTLGIIAVGIAVMTLGKEIIRVKMFPVFLYSVSKFRVKIKRTTDIY